MTISSSNRKAGPYTGNGSTTVFPFSFKVFSASDVQVIRTDLLSVQTTLVMGTDYTVTLNSNQNSNPGGSISMITGAPATGYLITLTSSLDYTQLLDLTNQGGFYPTTINDALDRQEIQIQQLAEQVGRAVKTDISSSVTPAQLISTLTTNANNAVAAAAGAAASQSAAAASQSSASSSATSAANSANTATTQASNASASASSAAASASTATTQAATATAGGATATTQAGIATTQATNAANSASAAASSASSASTSASNASTSATNAGNSATSAATSANSTAALLASFRSAFLGSFASDTAAAAFATANSITLSNGIMYENNSTTPEKFRIYNGSSWQDYDASAQASQSAAALSAANAASSAGAASTSATAASGSASAAATSATNAANSATTATTQASTATTQATNAASSATAAASSATSAASSATSAGTSATNAAASYTSFHNQYQGAYATAPTVRPDSSALQIGDLYFNTTTNSMQVRSSSGWTNAGSSVNGTSRRYRYIATSGQTTFTGSDSNANVLAYDAGFVDIYLNGQRLDQSDYTASSGTSIVLTVGAMTNDEINIIAFGTFSVSNFNGSGLVNGTVSANKYDVGNADGTGAMAIPSGTTAQRPISPAFGYTRYNTTINDMEFYDGSRWLLVNANYSIDYLVVAGGGGGGSYGGGGGAGGYLSSSTTLISTNTYTIVIGAGGTGANNITSIDPKQGANGSNSVFSSIATSIGGGGGGGNSPSTSAAHSGIAGGSGGGSSNQNAVGSPGSGTSGQGYAGGSSSGSAGTATGGGGGGASQVGVNGSGTSNGSGGNGATWLNGVTYAGGGGGCAGSYAGASGGAGGGGAGNATSPVSGTANTGGGGGAAKDTTSTGNGGSGVVIIRYAGSQRGTGGTVTSAGGYTYHTFTSSGSYTA